MLGIWELSGQLVSDTIILEGLADGNLQMSVSPNANPAKAAASIMATINITRVIFLTGIVLFIGIRINQLQTVALRISKSIFPTKPGCCLKKAIAYSGFAVGFAVGDVITAAWINH